MLDVVYLFHHLQVISALGHTVGHLLTEGIDHLFGDNTTGSPGLLFELGEGPLLGVALRRWPDDTLDPQSRNRQARALSSEHVVFDMRGRDTDSESYQKELARMADGLKQTQPRQAGIPVFEG